MYKKQLDRYHLQQILCIISSVVISVVLLCFFKTNLPDSGYTEEQQAAKIISNGEVLINTIEAPAFYDKFCTLLYSNVSHDVYWGSSEIAGSFVMWYESGYPGFSMPLVIEGERLTETDLVTLQTDYGKYVYRLVESGVAHSENHTLVDTNSERILTNYGIADEILFLYDNKTHHFWKLELCEQTYVNVSGS